MIIMQQQVLCNNKEAIRFDIHITQDLINFLIHDGYLEEEDFDFKEYLEETDVYESLYMGKPVSDGVIDFYNDLIDIKECEEYDKESRYRDTEFLKASTLMKYVYVADEDDMLGCVKVVDVTGEDKPYGWC